MLDRSLKAQGHGGERLVDLVVEILSDAATLSLLGLDGRPPSLTTLGLKPGPHPLEDESLAIIESELGPEPSDPDQRAVVRRVIHASADFELAQTLRFSPTAIDRTTAALGSGAAVLCDVEMLRPGVAYVRLWAFSRGAALETRRALAALGDSHEIRSIVLDLRGNEIA